MPFPNPDTQFQPGQSGNPGGSSRGRRITAELVKLIDAKDATRALATIWLREALSGNSRFFRLLIDRTEDPMPRPERLGSEARPIELEPPASTEDPAVWDWYGESCPCGLPVGECKQHPRARESQRPPAGNWRVWAYIAGRGSGKTRAGAEWIHHRVKTGAMRLGCLIAPTAADIRDVIVEGPSGLIATAAPDNRCVFEKSNRRVVWPNGAYAICLSGEEPERARGLNVDTLWADEMACWQRAEATWNMAMLALRAGTDPRAVITTTPRRLSVLKKVLAQSTTVKTVDTTFANKANLPEEFITQIVGMFEGTRLGQQEIYAEFLELTDGAWFQNFAPDKHVTLDAEYDPRFPVRLAVDAGTSRHTGAVYFQLRPTAIAGRPRVNVFADFHSIDQMSLANATAIKLQSDGLPHGGKLELVRVDPAATAKSGLGAAAYGEYEKVFGRLLARWPMHRVLDGLDTIELLLDSGCLTIHPRCVDLKEAFHNYRRKKRGQEWVDYPDDGHPEEDMMDALRGGLRDALPEGCQVGPALTRRHAGMM